MSFHPDFVFQSIPYSQILRTLRNNSSEEIKRSQVKKVISHFEASGYTKEKLNELTNKAIARQPQEETINTQEEKLIFSLYHFDGISEFKTMVRSLNTDISKLIGDTRIMFAMKKGRSIGSALMQNKNLSNVESISNSQQCTSRGCKQCPLVNNEEAITINNKVINIPKHLNCKTRNAIYMWVCKLCGQNKEVYFGRTIQESRQRTSGHRACFTNSEKWENSALSMHAKDVHQNEFNLDNFTISVVKKVSPQNLRREEFKIIDKYRTNSLGLNRYKV